MSFQLKRAQVAGPTGKKMSCGHFQGGARFEGWPIPPPELNSLYHRLVVSVLNIVDSLNAQVAGPTGKKMSCGHFQGGARFEGWPIPPPELNSLYHRLVVSVLNIVDSLNAQVAELVDALVSNTSDSNIVPVRSRPWAQASTRMSKKDITHAEKQLAIDKRYLKMARIWATNSYCKRRQVGALIVKDKMIISDGYNGTPSGFENECEDEDHVTKPYVLHAEANAITKVAKSNNSSEGSTLYITTSPCMECSKLIIQAGIKRVVFEERYRITDGLDLLERANIDLVHIPDAN